MKQIPLTQGKFAIVDDEDYERLMALGKWHIANGYAVRAVYFFIEGKRFKKTLWMHRIILNTPDGMVTDHKDCDTLNNQKSNIRICTYAENMRNKNKTARNKTGYKGVYYNKASNKYQATIIVNHKPIHLGLFKSVIDAAKAYDCAAIHFHGEFARTNFS